jgi:NAD+--asparagine ADP-ribosyltransferase
MCHHFHYSDIHRGHKVVSLEEAYRKLKIEYKENHGLLLQMKQFVDKRLNYFQSSRDKLKKVRRKVLNLLHFRTKNKQSNQSIFISML